jgi:hypothetical protein
MPQEKCPFKVGDVVVYKPTARGRGQLIMTSFSALIPGNTYKVVKIVRDVYIVLEGFENAAGGGIYWTEFAQ